ncbi:UNVERIFIED_CONTAM: hypothetical protein Sindi_2420400 [Sesamum indicum]
MRAAIHGRLGRVAQLDFGIELKKTQSSALLLSSSAVDWAQQGSKKMTEVTTNQSLMAEGKEGSEVKHPNPPQAFLEVVCKSSGKIRRFSVGTEAGFAVKLINKKLLNYDGGGGGNGLLASYIEAVKEGEEEPVSFGPSSLLVDYGRGWKLQTVIEPHGDKGGVHIGATRVRKSSANGADDSHSMRRTQSPISFLYIGKILLAFLLIFVFGAVFTLALENLPRLILYINSFV